MLNSVVVKISMMSAKYLEYYTIILRRPFFRGHTVDGCIVWNVQNAVFCLKHSAMRLNWACPKITSDTINTLGDEIVNITVLPRHLQPVLCSAPRKLPHLVN